MRNLKGVYHLGKRLKRDYVGMEENSRMSLKKKEREGLVINISHTVKQ